MLLGRHFRIGSHGAMWIRAALASIAFFGALTTIGVFLFGAQLWAQSAIPAGTILPVRLNTSLNSRKINPGQMITARVEQDVPLPAGSTIHAGVKVIGHVLDVKRGSGASVSIRFDIVEISKRQIPITTNLRAIANMMAVEGAQIPATGPDRGSPEEVWNTEQIGGDVVYRGGGPVAKGLFTVGEPAPNGVLARVSSVPGTPCRGDEGNDRLQALWVFSSDACGAYGFTDLEITHAGRTNPVGVITVSSRHEDINVRAGSGMLLRVD
jgi:hypothetical protein